MNEFYWLLKHDDPLNVEWHLYYFNLLLLNVHFDQVQEVIFVFIILLLLLLLRLCQQLKHNSFNIFCLFFRPVCKVDCSWLPVQSNEEVSFLIYTVTLKPLFWVVVIFSLLFVQVISMYNRKNMTEIDISFFEFFKRLILHFKIILLDLLVGFLSISA